MSRDATRTAFARPGGRRRRVYAAAAGLVILLGLAVRHRGLGLPWPLAKYAGSGLWGLMVYLLAGLACPRAGVGRRAGAAALAALLVELSRLYHAPALDAFRLTTAGALLLGRLFSPWNILAYWAGIALGGLADRRWDPLPASPERLHSPPAGPFLRP